MLTKKHFEAIAGIIQSNVEIGGDSAVCRAMAFNIASDLAGHFHRENPRFDRTRFMKACGF